MSFTKIHLVLLIVSISILFAPTTHAAGIQARVLNMCKTTTNPSLCYKTILPKALETPKFNMYKALEIEIQAAQVQVLKTATSIATLLWKSGSDKAIADSLTVCKNQYRNIVEAVTESVSLVSKRNVGDARFKFSAVISYYLACKESFEESQITSPIAADAQTVYDLGGNCLDLMKAIEDKERKSY
ncbi:unnamed protein product [Lathyrus oleraceus]|uniref:Pectinesterase inhibitor domain-containing protein n=1 Tax=Pisum sativum TaxID=3888 RepID=A0A9D5GZP4_PEA|nr:uncharacterized protein LOC127111613 [Pisum sativum]KAI5446867.1 hypothetical protein KIW84_014636 [Pisum sativum]